MQRSIAGRFRKIQISAVNLRDSAALGTNAGMLDWDWEWEPHLSEELMLFKESVALYLTTLPRGTKRLILMLADAAVLSLSMAATALMIERTPNLSVHAVFAVALAPIVGVLCLAAVGAYEAVVRFTHFGQTNRLAIGNCLAAVMLIVVTFLAGRLEHLWNLIVLNAMVAVLSLSSLRVVAGQILQPNNAIRTHEKVLIYGAGTAGRQLLAALRISGKYRPVAFVDDRADLHGRVLMGLTIHRASRLKDLKSELRFQRVLLAIPSLSRRRRREILESLASLSVQVLVVPSVEDIASGERKLEDLREVQVEDLLGRDAVSPDNHLMDSCIQGQVVMVTGAGGSIGSELCRQVLHRNVRQLILFEISEFALYSIHQELEAAIERQSRQITLVAILGSVTDRTAVERAMKQYSVNTVYHAAAYKHVPLVESNVLGAVANNVFGTLRVVESAIACGVSNFVLISTDKAVRPTSVMGASKRVSEVICQALAHKMSATRISMVRFGNVLNSSGSVVPLFRRQIQEGGPVTVTHPEITRYFMTIPEAAQLVIQAGAMGKRGEVFVLEMGGPVRIVDLARRMIRLAGLEVRDESNPDGDMEIAFTGLRPGEKLFEELLIGENPCTTAHPRIFLAREEFLPWAELQKVLVRLETSIDHSDVHRVLELLRELVPGYSNHATPRIEKMSALAAGANTDYSLELRTVSRPLRLRT